MRLLTIIIVSLFFLVIIPSYASTTITDSSITTPNLTVTGTLTSNSKVNFVTPFCSFTYCDFVNKTNNMYFAVNGTTQKIVFTESDLGLLMGDQEKTMTHPKGEIKMGPGNFTVFTPFQLNQSGIIWAGEGFGGYRDSPGLTSGTGTEIHCNVGGVTNDCVTIAAPSGFQYFSTIQDMSFKRSCFHCSRYLLYATSIHEVLHLNLFRIATIENNASQFAEMSLQGTDAIFIDQSKFFRNFNLVGNETQSYAVQMSSNIQVFFTNDHFSTPGALSTPPDALSSTSDNQVKISQSTFDSWRYPIQTTGIGDITLSNVGFYNDVQDYPKLNVNYHFGGQWQNYGNTGNKNYTSYSIGNRIMVGSGSNKYADNFTDNVTPSKQFTFDASSLNSNHLQKYGVTNTNGTMLLLTNSTSDPTISNLPNGNCAFWTYTNDNGTVKLFCTFTNVVKHITIS